MPIFYIIFLQFSGVDRLKDIILINLQVHAASTVTVLMSAIRQGSESSPGDNGMTTTQFSMHVPVPAYLIALVAGDLESR